MRAVLKRVVGLIRGSDRPAANQARSELKLLHPAGRSATGPRRAGCIRERLLVLLEVPMDDVGDLLLGRVDIALEPDTRFVDVLLRMLRALLLLLLQMLGRTANTTMGNKWGRMLMTSDG